MLKVTGPQAYEDVMNAVHEHLPPKHDPFVDLVPPQGIRLTPRHYAYLKISEGCNNKCSFCIIPSMRRLTNFPRMSGMMQKLHLLLQPSAIFTYA